jgi:hypothetical protein
VSPTLLFFPTSLNLFAPPVTPMESASQETRDAVWGRILSFAMHTDEAELFDRHIAFWKRSPSLLSFLARVHDILRSSPRQATVFQS